VKEMGTARFIALRTGCAAIGQIALQMENKQELALIKMIVV
jgi:hypothetical protein